MARSTLRQPRPPAPGRSPAGSARCWLGVLLGLVTAAAPGSAAHEWRAAWGAPAMLGALEASLCAVGGPSVVSLSLARPFGLPGVSFQRAEVRAGRWEVHAGGLSSPLYSEWHGGVGLRVALGTRLGLLLGGRLFGIRVPGARVAPRAAGTLLLSGAPALLPGVTLEGGAVDLADPAWPEGPEPLIVARLRFVRGTVRFVAERMVGGRGAAGLGLGFGFRLGRVRVVHGVRWGTGECLLAVACRQATLQVSLSGRYHPRLGWTPGVALDWLRGAPGAGPR